MPDTGQTIDHKSPDLIYLAVMSEHVDGCEVSPSRAPLNDDYICNNVSRAGVLPSRVRRGEAACGESGPADRAASRPRAKVRDPSYFLSILRVISHIFISTRNLTYL